MKYITCICIFMFSFLACRKNTQDQVVDNCPLGFFVGMTPYSTGQNTSSQLFKFEVDSAQVGPSVGFFESFGYLGYHNYDYNKNYYNVISKSHDSIYLTRYSFETQKTDNFHYRTSEFTTPDLAYGELLNSNNANKMYSWYRPHNNDSTDRICELTLIDNVCIQKTIYYLDFGVHPESYLFDERNGYVYYINFPQLVRLNPANNIVSVVAIFNNTHPYALKYNNTDGMFYGIDIGHYPYNFVKLDPERGDITTIAPLPYIDTAYGVVGMFDQCRQYYIINNSYYDSTNIYYIDIKYGKKIKEYHKSIFWGSEYVSF